MADNRKPKTEDTKRAEKDNPVPAQNQEGANRDLQDRRQGMVGDNTSSSAGNNNPGQHGRDGGTINEVDNNPAPSKEVISGDRADDTQKDDKELKKPAEEIKKL